MKLKTLPLALAALLFSGVSVVAFAADEPTKPTADQGTSMPQPDKAKTDQGSQAAKPAGTDVAAWTYLDRPWVLWVRRLQTQLH